MIELRRRSGDAWLRAVLDDFDAFLLDHAAAERKASAVALSLIAHYPDRRELVTAMVDLAREELEHFHQVYRRIDARGGTLGADAKDAYVRALRAEIRSGRDTYLLDRLLVAGIVEARGCERFGVLAEALADPALAAFYRDIAASETRHSALFVELARCYFADAAVRERLATLLDAEGEILDALPARAALH